MRVNSYYFQLLRDIRELGELLVDLWRLITDLLSILAEYLKSKI